VKVACVPSAKVTEDDNFVVRLDDMVDHHVRVRKRAFERLAHRFVLLLV